MVSSLLRDGASPFYLQTVPGELERCAQVTLDCLVGQPWVSSPDPPLTQGAGIESIEREAEAED
jgi:hypothetical protein